jgi:hypothetical protein
MLNINREKNYSNNSYVNGTYNNKFFELSYYYNDGSYKVSGDLTESEKKNIVDEWLVM